MISFIVGNGPSRSAINVEALMDKGTVWGCNALYRDFTPHHLVVADRAMQREVRDSGYLEANSTFFVDSEIHNIPTHENLKLIPARLTTPKNSGVAALWAALKYTDDEFFFLVGFDFGEKQDNLYKGTQNYETVGITPDPVIKFLCHTTVFKRDKTFYRVMGPESQVRKEVGLNPPFLHNITTEEFVGHFGEKIWAKS